MPSSATLLEDLGFDVPRNTFLEEQFSMMMQDTFLNTVISHSLCGSMDESELDILAILDRAYFELWVQEDIEAAKSEVELAEALDADHPDVLFINGMIAYNEGHFAKALRYLVECEANHEDEETKKNIRYTLEKVREEYIANKSEHKFGTEDDQSLQSSLDSDDSILADIGLEVEHTNQRRCFCY